MATTTTTSQQARETKKNRLKDARLEIWPGAPFPLGATFDGVGANFSVFSEVAERVVGVH